MSYDLAIWKPKTPLSPSEAESLYISLCESQIALAEDLLLETPAIQLFYDELYSIHPEIDDIPEDRIDDHEYCPWSCAHDKSTRHMILACVWSQAEHVYDLVHLLAQKHGLSVHDPQSEAISIFHKSKFERLSSAWASLTGLQRLLLGLLVVSLFMGLVFIVVYICLVPSP